MIDELERAFADAYGRPPTVVTRAPGRLEILGNHTDYNEGVVLSVAVDRATHVAVAVRNDDRCTLLDARSGSRRTFRLQEVARTRPGDWANYVRGIIIQLQRRGVTVPGFDAVLRSTIPMSAGMSSSAALEISVAYALGELAGARFPWVEWARIGQACENETVGANTGLLDQFSSIKGQEGHLVFSDFRSLDVDNVPLPDDTALVVANSMVKHNLTGQYNERRRRCEEAVAVLRDRYDGVTALRDVSPAQLEQCREAMPLVAYRRARHVVEENDRVLRGSKALENGALEVFGALMFDSHESSRRHFENSCPELDTMVEIGKSLPGSIGARLSGGGFGGITVHLVAETQADDYARRLATAYRNLTGTDPETMICHAGRGAEVLRKA